jgi:hypothetical protein
VQQSPGEIHHDYDRDLDVERHKVDGGEHREDRGPSLDCWNVNKNTNGFVEWAH